MKNYLTNQAIASSLETVLLFTFLMMCLGSFAQPKKDVMNSVIPPSPNAAALGKYGEIPVSLYTGTASIEIPIYEIKTADYTVPVSLSYHPSGIRVDEESSWVGLGWTLNAGGVITRSVAGLNDDHASFGYLTGNPIPAALKTYTPLITGSDGNTYASFLKNVSDNYKDTEPDVFYYNFNGYSGKFVFDENGVPQTIPFSTLRIEVNPHESPLMNFTVITPDGIRYLFGGTGYVEESRPEYAQYSDYYEFLTQTKMHEYFKSAWYLRQIKSPNGELVNFTYQPETIQNESNFSQTRFIDIYNNVRTQYSGNSTVKNFINALRLYKINSGPCEVEFYTNKVRQDLNSTNAKVLEKIIIRKNGNVLSNYVFNTGYFQSSGTGAEYLKKRLKLISVQEFSADMGTSKPPYSFTYDEAAMSPRNSFSQDHWGYYNGRPNPSLVPSLREKQKDVAKTCLVFDGSGRFTASGCTGDQGYLNPDQFFLVQYAGADREPRFPEMRALSLTGIVYPTQGYTNFTYEPHNFKLPVPKYVFQLFTNSANANNSNASFNTAITNVNMVQVLQGVNNVNTTLPFYADVTIGFSALPYMDELKLCPYPKASIYFKDVTSNQVLIDFLASGNAPSPTVYPAAGTGTAIEKVGNSWTIHDVAINPTHTYTLYASNYPCQYLTEPVQYSNCTMQMYIPTNTVETYNATVGGLRISKIESGGNTFAPTVKKYIYKAFGETQDISSGEIGQIPVYMELQKMISSYYDPAVIKKHMFTLKEGQNHSLVTTTALYTPIISISSGSRYVLGQTNGKPVGYKEVQEWICDNTNATIAAGGKIIHRFTGFGAYPDVNPSILGMGFAGSSGSFVSIADPSSLGLTRQYPPFAPPTGYDYKRGLLTEQEFRSSSDVLVKKIVNTYNNVSEGNNLKVIDALKVADFTYRTDNARDIMFEKYSYRSAWNYLKSKTETTYDINGNNGVSVTSNYFYDNPAHAQLTRTEVVNGDGTTFISRNRYPHDYADGSSDVYATAIREMKSNNVRMINTIIESTTSVKKTGQSTELVTGGEIAKYKQYAPGQYLPEQFYTLETPTALSNFVASSVTSGLFKMDSRYVQQSAVLSYSLNGKPLELQKVKDVSTSILWDRNFNLPLAEVRNASSTEIEYNSFEGIESTAWTNINSNNDAHTGAKSSLIPANTFGPTRNLIIGSSGQNKKYTFSAWVKTSANFPSGKGILILHTFNAANNTGIYPNVGAAYKAAFFGATNNTWQYVQVEIDLTAVRQSAGLSNAINLGLAFYIWNQDTNNSILVDDFRLSPSQSAMQTLTYDYLERPLTISDPAGRFQRLDYDVLSRLRTVRDQNNFIQQLHEYFYKNSSTPNYIKTTTPLVPVSTVSDIGNLAGDAKKESFQYMDGLGTISQNIEKEASGLNGRDIVLPVAYDALGRQVKKYLPFVPNQTSGAFISNAISAQNTFYTNGTYRIPATNYAYTENQFENSPLNRILESAESGTEWKLNDHHTIRYTYGCNTSGTATEPAIRLFTLSGASEAASGTTWAAGSLNKKITTDPDNNKSIVFTDKLGRTIAQLKESATNTYLCTYYVHDDFGNIAVVIPPKAFKLMQTANNYSTAALSQDLVFRYVYDSRKRLVEKKVPGSGWEYIVYNPIDQPVLTQTANQRAGNQWNFVRYDALGRMVLSGTWNASFTPSYQSRTGAQNYINTLPGVWYETESSQNFSTQFGYSNTVFPTQNISIDNINYYDHYDYDRNGVADVSYNTAAIPVIDISCCNYDAATGTTRCTPLSDNTLTNTYSSRLKGLLTGNRRKVLDAASGVQWLYNNTFYDEYARIIQQQNNDVLASTDLTNFHYDFRGRVLYKHHIHTQSNGISIPILNSYFYDKMDRLKEEWQKNSADAPVVLSRKKYNELGQLAENDLHATNRCGTFLQSIDYSYNTRGWLTGINNLAFSNQGDGAGASNNDVNDLWALELAYVSPTSILGTGGLYNGNITEKRWKSATDNIARYYSYSYDKLSRLTNAKYSELVVAPSTFGNTDRYKEGNISYDENGNILGLTRSGFRSNSTFGTMDQLTYTYSGNRLNTVAEAATIQGYNDFKDLNTSGTDYFYDTDGNLIQDKNKGITITYNRFNLPELITYSGNRTIQYTYASDGSKLRKKVNNNGSVINTWYCGKFIYTDAGLESFLTSEGRAVNNGSAMPKYRYEYQYKDQLGNVSLAFSDLNNNGSIEKNSEVIQQTSYYPFGMDFYGTNYTQIGAVNKFKFNGKELQDDFSLNLYDYGARFYDVQLGRWQVVDPMAEKGTRWGPYCYAFDNPVRFIDPDGMWPAPIITGPIQMGRTLLTAVKIMNGGLIVSEKLLESVKGKGKYINVPAGVEMKNTKGNGVGDSKDINYVKRSVPTIEIEFEAFKGATEIMDVVSKYNDKHPDSKESVNDKLTYDRNTKTRKEERELVTPNEEDETKDSCTICHQTGKDLDKKDHLNIVPNKK